MVALTPSERRGAVVLLVLLALGAARDLWRAWRPPPAPALVVEEPATAPHAGGSETERAPGDPPGVAGAPAQRARTAPAPSGAGPDRAIDLNRAGPGELDALPGIGPVLAERIVLQRRRYGPFRGLEDLLAVRGVGPALLDRIRPWAIVRAPRAPSEPAETPPDSVAGADR